MQVKQKLITIDPFERGFHLITHLLQEHFDEWKIKGDGILQVFIQHTSASLSINENADQDVRHDLEAYLNKLIPENLPYFKHTYEGSDDMPAHIKTSFIGTSVQIPVTKGKWQLGTWQGIYLGEHRNQATKRKLLMTYIGH